MSDPTPPPAVDSGSCRDTVANPPAAPVGETLPYDTPLPAQAAPPAPGIPFGRYRLLRELGHGGMGVVWQAWDSQLQRVVALKQLWSNESSDLDRVDRLLREARLAARLQHPGIASVFDAGEHEGTRYLTLEFVDGVSLLAAMAVRVPLGRALGWVHEIAEALQYAHTQGVIHRDIKPANVLLDVHGRTRVVDFGLARDLDPRAGASRTATGALVGTPQYMSPEQALGRTEQIRPASDQYALGVIFYELLTGRPPFTQTENLRDLLNAIVERDPVPPRTLDPAVPRDAETVCLKALDKDPARRYASLGEFAADIARLQAGEPVLARPLSTVGLLARTAARHRSLVLAGAASLLVVASLGAWAWRQAEEHRGRIAEALDRARQAEAATDHARAGRAYADVLALAPDHPEAAAGRSRAEERIRAREQARQTAQRLLDEAVPLLEQATAALRRPVTTFAELARKVDRVEALLAQAIPLASDLPQGPYLLGRVRELQGREGDALASWAQAIRLDPDFGPARYHRGRLLLRYSFLSSLPISSAAGVIDTAVARPLAAEVAREFAAAFRVPWRRDSDEEVLARDLACAIEAYVRGARAEAIRACLEAIARLPDAEGIEEAHWLLGVTVAGRGGEEELDRALQLRPKYPLALYCRASLRHAAGDLAGARADLDTAVEFSPLFNMAWCNRAAVRRDQGDRDGAIADYTEALRIFPGMVLAWNGRGLLRADGGDLEGAIADFTEAFRLSPKYAAAMSNRAWVRLRQEAWAEAIADATAAIGADPRTPAAWLNRGEAHRARSEKGEAAADYRAALDEDPACLGAWTGLARLAEEGGDRAAGLRTFDEAIRANPRVAKLFNDRALLRARGDDHAGAIADLDRAIALAPRMAEVYANRAGQRGATGDLQGMISDYERALEVAAPEWPLAPKLRYLAVEARGLLAIAAWDYASARPLLERAVALAVGLPDADLRPRLAVIHVDLACIDALLAEGRAAPEAEPRETAPAESAQCRERAFAWLNRALDLDYTDAGRLDSDPDLASLRADPRWAECRARLGR